MKHNILILSIFILSPLAAHPQDLRTIRIPVVFHIVYANAAQNISRDSIVAELKNLHNDFLVRNNDIAKVREEFKSRIGNPNVEFVLADSIFAGNTERGIIRVADKRNTRKLYKRSDVVDPEHYLNVYVGDLPEGKDGYTYTPQSPGFKEWDVVHAHYKWIGKRYRLLTHEAGHWLGLYHVFEGGCKDGDKISDTYPQAGQTDGDCDFCPPQNGVTDQGCNGGPSNYENFMDYSGCRKMFTVEQAKRIRNTIQTMRPKIWGAK